jgi:hypothetical protein
MLIGIFTPWRLTSQRGTTRLLSLSPLTTATLLSSTNALISWPFKSFILRLSLRRVPLLPLNPVVRRRLPFFPIHLFRVLLGVMTPPRSRLRPGHLLPPSHAMLLFLPPLVAPILTGSTALLLSSGEWGEWGVLASSVTLPPPMGFTPQDLLSARVSRLPPRLSIFASFTSQVPYPRRFLRSSLAVTIIPHLLGGFVMLLHLLSTIIMRLHLWRRRLHLLLRRCVLCLKRISLLLRRWTLPCLSWLQTPLLWRFHRPLLHLFLASLLLPRFPLLLSWSSLPLRFLFVLRSLSSFLSSRTPKLIWMCTT